MYKNVGKVLCVMARIIGIIGLLAVVVGLIWTLSADPWMRWLPLIILGGGVVLFISSFPLYAFGQLVDDVHIIRNKNE